MYMGILHTYLSVHPVWAWYPQSPQFGVRPTRTGIIDSCELSSGWWELKLCLMNMESFLLTAEPSFPSYKNFP